MMFYKFRTGNFRVEVSNIISGSDLIIFIYITYIPSRV